LAKESQFVGGNGESGEVEFCGKMSCNEEVAAESYKVF
jgi:hypothetical protein